MATGLHAEWIAVAVETPKTLRLAEPERDQIVQTLRLAEQLGAETITLSGQRASEELLSYAQLRNVSKIVVGKPAQSRWKEPLVGSTVDELVRGSGAIDVYVITGEQTSTPPPPRLIERTSDWSAYAWGVAVVALSSAAAWLMVPYFALANVIMVYLLGVIVVANRFGRGPAIIASVLSVAAFDFFFVPPYLTFAVADVEYVITFMVMLLAGLLISSLTARLRQQADSARTREQRIAALYALSREFASNRSIEKLLRAAVQNTSATFDSQIVILMPNAASRLQAWGNITGWWGDSVKERMVFAPDTHDQGVAQWVYDHGQMAGLNTTTLPGAKALYLPLIGSGGAIGVLGMRPAQPRRFLAPEQLHLLETFASQIALALERVELADEAQRAQLQIETERLRSSLLSSVSHDLRTPLAVITGATSSLLEGGATLDPATRDELAQTAYAEAERLNRLVSNLLDMTRIEAGAVQVQKEWQPLEEVVGVALARLDGRLSDHPLTTSLPADLPLVPLDSTLIEQVLINLLENAIKHTPAGCQISISASASRDAVTVAVADRGSGITPGDEGRIFEKFYRAEPANDRGVGLGLTICRGIITAHGGRIWAENQPGGGAVLRFTLPLEGTPPQLAPEDVPLLIREDTRS